MICIINCGTSWLLEIKQIVRSLRHTYKVITVNKIKNTNFKSFSGIIISGAPIILTNSNKKSYMDLFKFVKQVDLPILGICLGHQIIGLLYGSHIKQGKMINKMEQIKIVHENALFTDVKNNALFREEHSEYINLPPKFMLIATSKSCDNEAMKHKNIYGVQFHPEVSGRNGILLLQNFLKMCV